MRWRVPGRSHLNCRLDSVFLHLCTPYEGSFWNRWLSGWAELTRVSAAECQWPAHWSPSLKLSRRKTLVGVGGVCGGVGVKVFSIGRHRITIPCPFLIEEAVINFHKHIKRSPCIAALPVGWQLNCWLNFSCDIFFYHDLNISFETHDPPQ